MTGTDRDDEDLDTVLVVPNRLTNTAYELLLENDLIPRPWHLEGRYGSRIHRIDGNTHTALPIIQNERNLSNVPAELQDILQHAQIQQKPFSPSRRVQDRPCVDGRLHPERAPLAADHAYGGGDDDDKTTPPTTFTYAELFAGIGGFGVALDALGGRCVFCSEWDAPCQAVYRRNFPGIPIHGDICAVPDESLPTELDLLVGGFPCQPFSALGVQDGLTCPKQGHLIWQIVRVLRVSKPAAFLLENVPGLQAMTETFNIIMKALQEAGYTVTTEVCSSRGVTATNRKRLYFVGFRNEMYGGGESSAFEFPFVPDLKLRSVHVLDYDDLEDAELLQLLRLAPSTMQQLLTHGRWKPAKLAWPNAVCNSIIGHYGNSVGRGESQLVPGKAPHTPRRFSPRECARLMGFPNTFLMGEPSRSDQGAMAYCKEQYRMLGNAVCPPLIAALAGTVLANIFSDETWVTVGRTTATRLAWAATRSEPSSSITRASVPERFFLDHIHKDNR